MADRLGIPLQELQEKTTSSEFVEWCRYLEMEVNLFHREDSALAIIAAEVARGHSKNPQKVKVEDYLPRFKTDQGTKQEESQDSKATWLKMFGIKE